MNLNEKYLHKTSQDTMSVTSRTTSDYFPQSYKRPAPYLLWDDNIVPIHFPDSRTFSCCRLLMGILISVAVLGVIVVISIAVYLGVMTSSLMEEVNNEQTFDGRLRVTRGDEYVVELEDQSSLEFQLKAKKYETMLNMLLKESSLKNGFKDTEVTGFKSGSLLVFFRVNLDRRKVQSHPQDFANAIQNVIALDASSKHPRVLKDLSIDLGSLSVWDSYTKKKMTPVAKVKPAPVKMVPDTKHVISSSLNLQFNSTSRFLDDVGESTNESQKLVKPEVAKAFPGNPSDITVTISSGTISTTFSTQPSSELNHENVTNDASVTRTTMVKPTTVTAPAVTQVSLGTGHGVWTRFTGSPFKLPKVRHNTASVTVSSSSVPPSPSVILATLRQGTAVPNRVTGKGFLQSTGQTFKRVEPLTSGVAHEIPFSLDDLSFHDLGSHEDTVASTPQRSSVPTYSMEANVATMLLLKPPVSEPSSPGDAVSRSSAEKSERVPGALQVTTPRSGRQTAFKPFRSVLRYDGQSSSQAHVSTGEVRISSEPVRRPEVSPPIGEVQAMAVLDLGEGKPNSREATKNPVTSSLRHRVEFGDSGPVPILVADPSRTVSSSPLNYREVNQQSGEVLLADSKKIEPSESANVHRELFDDLMNHEWVTAPLRRHTVVSSSAAPEVGGQGTNLLMTNGSEVQSSATTSGSGLIESESLMDISSSDNQSDPLIAEEQIFEPTSVPQQYDSLILRGPGNIRNAPCLPGMFVCPKAEICITMSKVCDSMLDCPKGEDEKYCECGTRPMASSPRIVGGSNAFAGSWPWQAAMYKGGEYMCGATLINNRWLISAAHCFYNEVTNHWTARLGMLQRGRQAPYEQIRRISHIIIHQQYVKVGFINDVAMLRMQNTVAYSDYIRPACLPSATEDGVYDGRMCTVVGWGQLMETGHLFPDTLQEVELPIYTVPECRKKTFFLQTYQITENMFCAGYDRGGRDACLGDSGGPLICQETNGRWTLIGITSNGFGCARAWRPGIYTKVGSYLTWINQIMSSPLRNPVRTFCRGHRCQLGQCLPASSVCNGFMDCLDGSDEQGCS